MKKNLYLIKYYLKIMEVNENNSDQDYLYELGDLNKKEAFTNNLNYFSGLNKLLSNIIKSSTIFTKFNTGKEIL